MSTVLSEQEQLRRQALQSLVDLGIDPYPAEEFEISANAADILKITIEISLTIRI